MNIQLVKLELDKHNIVFFKNRFLLLSSGRFKIFHNFAAIFIIVATILSISGCGNKGALTLPVEKPVPVNNTE